MLAGLLGKMREINKAKSLRIMKKIFTSLDCETGIYGKLKPEISFFFKIVLADKMQTTPETTLWQS